MKIKSIIALAALLGLSTACKESFFDINTNPNVLPTATPNFLFTNAENVTASNMQGLNETGQYWSGQWTQSNGYIISTTLFIYNFTNGDFNYWDGIYDNLQDYQFVIDNADANDQKYFKGPAKVMKAMLTQQLVDVYGNVPYSDALKGVSSLAPKFDDQKVVYDNLITLLDEAIVDIKANTFASAFQSSDIIFRGNNIKWVKFANSVKLRILMRQALVSGKDSFIKTELNKIASEGSGFITNEDIGIGGPSFFLPTAGKLNPIYERFGYSATGAKQALNNYPRLTDFLVKSLKAANDTVRLKRLGYATGGESTATAGISAKPELAANYVGVPFGASSGFLPSAASALGPSLLVKGDFNRAFIVMTASEIQLNLAEAKQRYGAGVNFTGTAQEYFEEGIKQSFRALGANVAAAANLKTGGKVNYDWTASPDKIQAISYQKWLTFCNFNGLEAWNAYRKNDYPMIPQSVQVPDSKRPVRFFYPSTETGSNGANVKAQGDVDVFNSRIFWDVK